jgi:hypothetical protein
MPCGDEKYNSCLDCPNYHGTNEWGTCNKGYDITEIIMPFN